MSAPALFRLAARVVPRPWREGVARDLEDECGLGPAAAGQLLAIGVRLRSARALDACRHPRAIAGPLLRSHPMRDITRDLLLAVRSAFRRPGYALAVIATLAIGIGAATAIFSMFNWILFRPLPGADRPDQLVTVRYQTPARDGSFWVSYLDYADLRDRVTSFTALAASSPLKMDVALGGDAERLDGEVVTTNYFTLFGVRPIAGRDFMPSEERPGGHEPAAIVSRRFWRRALNGDPAAIGRTLTIDGRTFRIAGVAPGGFQGRSLVTVTDVWIPIGAYPTLQPQSGEALLTSRRATFFGDAFGRLRPGVSLDQAQAEAARVAAASPEFANRSPTAAARSRIGPVLAPGVGIEIYTQERLATVFRLLMGAVSLLLLLSCANAGNLLLARVTGRRREIAVAHAIGASRFRIVRQQLVEGLVLSTAAGVVGLALAYALTQLFDGMRIIMSLPAVTGVGLDGRVLAFALGASLVTGVIFAAAPALVGSRVDLQSALKDGITTRPGGRRVLRASLVTVQVTVSVVLLVVAGLFVRTLQNIRSLDVGLRPDGLISFTVNPGRYGYTPERTQTYFRDLLDRLRATPGVEQAAFSWTTSFSPMRADTTFLPADRGEKISAMTTFVSRGFFDTMRIPVIAGRDFTDAEVREANDAASAIVVSRRLAAALVPDGEALGAQVPVAYPKGKVVRIVGIAGDVRGRTMTAEPPLFAYLPEPHPSWGTIQVRSPLPAAAAIAAIRDVTRGIDPLVLPADLERFDASIDRALAEQRLFARLSSLFAAIAAVLAGIGIYAMMAGAVSERRREFGIRVALGAPARSVLVLVLRYALGLAGIGALLGLGGAIALRRILETRLYGVTAADPLTIAVAVTALIGVALAAGLVPGLRAARVDPVRSLRVD